MIRPRQDGMALVLVLWLTTLLAVMAAGFSLDARREASLLRTARHNAQGTALCEGAMHYAMGRLKTRNALLRWRADGSVYEVIYGGARVRVQLLDEASKVDLNLAQETLLQGLFVAVGLPTADAARMANVVMDWRDPDDLKRFQGAEAEDYRLTGRNFGPRNQPFLAVEELQTVLGMTPELYQRLQPWVTVYSKQTGLDIRVAPADLLRRLPGIDGNAVEAYLQARALAASMPLAAVPSQGQQQQPPQLPPLQLPPGIPIASAGGSGRVVGVRAEALLADDASVAVSAVMDVARLSGERPASAVLHWREGAAPAPSLFALPILDRVILEMPMR